MSRRPRFGDLPLSWKLLLPSLGLIVVFGAVGGFLIVRDLSVRSQNALDIELSRRSLDATAVLRDRELSLLESVNFAANLEGMAASVRARDQQTAARLLQSVVALKTDLEIFAVTDADGAALVEFTRREPHAQPSRGAGRDWRAHGFVAEALADEDAAKIAGSPSVDGHGLLAIAAPVCAGRAACEPVGAAIVGVGLERVAADALQRLTSPEASAGLAIFDPSGAVLAAAGPLTAPRPPPGDEPVRVDQRIASTDAVTLYAPFDAGGRRLGTTAVSIPIEPTLASVRRTGLGLGLVLIGAIAGIAIIGILLSRLILRQVRSLVATNRALGRGDLSARAAVPWNDEIGELAERLNETAEQLQAMYQTLELRVAQRTEEVERLLRERTEFFASVSHELRTPLAVILRHAEMLLDDAYKGNGRWRAEAGSALKDSGGQLAGLIDDILELAEVEAAGLEVGLEHIDLAAALRDLRPTIEPLARAAGLRASVRVPRSGLPPVLADPRRLRQIVLNLVDNAVKYTPEGGRIDVSASALGDDVELTVSDTGVGIPPDAGNHVFEPFYRVQGTKTQAGQASSGLGLAIAKRLVEAHGGALSYTARPEGGTTFSFTLLPIDDTASPVAIGSADDERDA